jgi:hypothetical protein
MRTDVSKHLFANWSALKGARAAPNRCDIDPGAIRDILADTFIIEVDAACRFPLRLCGTRLDALWLREQKGRSFVELWRDDDRRNILAALLTVIEGASPVIAGVTAATSGDAPLELELLLLPLRHFGKTHSRVLGSLSAACAPEWLGRRCVDPLKLVSLRVITAETGPGLHRPLAPAAPFRVPRQRPRLVVYQGDKA